MARKRTRNGGLKADEEEDEGEKLEQKPPTVASISAPDPDAITPVRVADKMVQRKTFCIGPAPFDNDDVAIEERESCDYSIKITQEMIDKEECPRRVRVYADGIFDMFHQGHSRMLLQAKNVFPNTEVYLLVGVCSDELTHSRKGKTVMDEDERYEAVRHCRYVDEIVKDAPWSLDDDFLTKHKIDFVAHDELPYTTGSGVDVYAHLKEKGMFVATQRTEGVSTSDVVARIVRDYDMYVRRNLARGYTRKELNVSFLRGQRLKLANKMDEAKSFIDRKKDEYVQKWEDTSKEVIGTFLNMFGQRFDLEHFWNTNRRRITQALSPVGSPEASDNDSENEDEESEDVSKEIFVNEEPSPKRPRH